MHHYPEQLIPSMECQSEQSDTATSSSHNTNSVWVYGNYDTASGSHGQTYGDRDEARPRHNNLIDLTKKNQPVFGVGYDPYMAPEQANCMNSVWAYNDDIPQNFKIIEADQSQLATLSGHGTNSVWKKVDVSKPDFYLDRATGSQSIPKSLLNPNKTFRTLINPNIKRNKAKKNLSKKDVATQFSLKMKYEKLLKNFDIGTKHCDKSLSIIARVAKYFQLKETQKDLCTKAGVVSIAANVCGVKESTVLRALDLFPNPTDMPSCSPNRQLTHKQHYALAVSKISYSLQDKIRRTIHLWYKEKRAIRIRPLLSAIKEGQTDKSEINNISPSTFSFILHGLGYRFGRTAKNDPILIEDPKLVFWRRLYLNKIVEYRKAGYLIIYLDETWVWSNMSQRFDWKLGSLHDMIEALKNYGTAGPKASVDRGKRGIVIGAMSEKEIIIDACEVWIEGEYNDLTDYHTEMKSHNFENWLNRSIPKFKASAKGAPILCVMDNASYHSRKIEKPPSPSSTKSNISEFLINHEVISGSIEIVCRLNKADLVEILTTFLEDNGGKETFTKKAVEEICIKNEIELLRLPPNHCIFNPIEMVWSYGKENTKSDAIQAGSIQAVKSKFIEWIGKITPEQVSKYVKHVIKVENEYREAENIIQDSPPYVYIDNERENDLMYEEAEEALAIQALMKSNIEIEEANAVQALIKSMIDNNMEDED